MTARVLQVGSYVNGTQAANLTLGALGSPIQLIGIYVNSTNSGTIVLKETNTSGAVITGTITPAIGYHRFPVDCPNGLFVTLGGTGINVTVFYVPNG